MIRLATAVERYYEDKPVPRTTVLLLTDICTSAAAGETLTGIARRLGVDVMEVYEVIQKDEELSKHMHR